MRLKQSSSSYPFSPFFVKFFALLAYAHINALWPSIWGSVSQNLSVSYPVYVSSSIIYAYNIMVMSWWMLVTARPLRNYYAFVTLYRHVYDSNQTRSKREAIEEVNQIVKSVFDRLC